MGRVGNNHNLIRLDPDNPLPRNAPPFLSCGPALDETSRTAHQSGHLAALAMYLVDASELFAVERSDLLVAQLREKHHKAPF